MPHESSHKRSLAFDAFITGALCLLACFLASTIPYRLDVHGCDEDSYCLIGALFPNAQLAPSWGPVYSFWHAFLFLFVSDRLDEFYFNFQLLVVLTPAVLFPVFRFTGFSRASSTLLTLVFLLSPSSLYECPQANHFAVLIFLLGLPLAAIFTENDNRIGFLALWTLILSYIRPEYFLAAMPIALFALVRFRLRPFPIIFLALFILGMLTLGIPVRDSVYNRNIEAFGPGFAYHWNIRHGENRNVHLDRRPLVEREFGDVKGPFDAFLKRPGLILQLAVDNVADFPRVGRETFLSGFLADPAVRAIFGLGAFCVAFLAFLSRRHMRDSVVQSKGERSPERVYALSCAGGIFISMLFPALYPRFIYSLSMVVVLAGRLLIPPSRAGGVERFRRLDNVTALTVLISLFLLVFRSVTLQPPPPPSLTPVAAAVRTAESMVPTAAKTGILFPQSMTFLFMGKYEVRSFENLPEVLSACAAGDVDFAVLAQIPPSDKQEVVSRCFPGPEWKVRWDPVLRNLVAVRGNKPF